MTYVTKNKSVVSIYYLQNIYIIIIIFMVNKWVSLCGAMRGLTMVIVGQFNQIHVVRNWKRVSPWMW